jgi:hypothetical protein
VSYNKKQRLDKRRGPDTLLKTVRGIGIVSWIFIFVILFIVDRAKPQVETFFDRFFQVQLQQVWDLELLRYAFFLMFLVFFLCIIALFINSRRVKRKTDRYNPSVIIIAVLSFLGMIIYLIKI